MPRPAHYVAERTAPASANFRSRADVFCVQVKALLGQERALLDRLLKTVAVVVVGSALGDVIGVILNRAPRLVV